MDLSSIPKSKLKKTKNMAKVKKSSYKPLPHDISEEHHDFTLHTPPPMQRDESHYPPRSSTPTHIPEDIPPAVLMESDPPILTNLSFFNMPPLNTPTPNCLHTSINMGLVPHIVQAERNFHSVKLNLSKHYSEREMASKFPQKAYCVRFKSSSSQQNEAKLPNLNMVLCPSDKNIVTQVWFNSGIQNFVLGPTTALLTMSKLLVKLRTPATELAQVVAAEGVITIHVNAEEGIKIVKSLDHITTVFHIPKIFDIVLFLNELESIISILNYHIDLGRIREDFRQFVENEFVNCKCTITNEVAVKIVLTYYYTQLGQKYSLIPHYISVTDLIRNFFVYV